MELLAVVAVLVLVWMVVSTLSNRQYEPEEELILSFRRGWTSNDVYISSGVFSRLIRALFRMTASSGRGEVLVFPLLDRVVRVRGELMFAWHDALDALPLGVSVSRPARKSDFGGEWVVRARGWERWARDARHLEMEAHGDTEIEALTELTSRLLEMAQVPPPPRRGLLGDSRRPAAWAGDAQEQATPHPKTCCVCEAPRRWWSRLSWRDCPLCESGYCPTCMGLLWTPEAKCRCLACGCEWEEWTIVH